MFLDEPQCIHLPSTFVQHSPAIAQVARYGQWKRFLVLVSVQERWYETWKHHCDDKT